MRSRFLTNLVFVVLGGFLAIASMAFGVPVFTWLMFGAGIAALVLAAPAVTVLARGRPQRGIDGVISLLGAWTIVASMVFGGLAITWLGFTSGVALIAFALAGLALHELSTERVVHSFEVRTPAAERELGTGTQHLGEVVSVADLAQQRLGLAERGFRRIGKPRLQPKFAEAAQRPGPCWRRSPVSRAITCACSRQARASSRRPCSRTLELTRRHLKSLI